MPNARLSRFIIARLSSFQNTPRTPLRAAALLAAAAMLLAACQTPVAVEPIEISMNDGFRIAATWYGEESSDQAVVFFNDCGPAGDQALYEPLARELARAGFAALTHDFRGAAASRTPEFDITNEDHYETIRSHFGMDTMNMLGFASIKHDVVAVVGAGCGAMRLADLSDELPHLRALVALGGGATEHGAETVAALQQVDVLGVVSARDTQGQQGITRLVEAAPAARERVTLPGEAQGQALLAASSDITGTIRDFIVDATEEEDAGSRRDIGRMESFVAMYNQGGQTMGVAVSNPSPGLMRTVMHTQMPGTGQLLADTIEHTGDGAFVRRSFDFLAGDMERVLVGVRADSLIALRQPREGGQISRSAEPLMMPLVDGTWAHWMLGTMNLADHDSVMVPTWRMSPEGPLQEVSVFHRASSDPSGRCEWWEARRGGLTLRSCITTEPPYLMGQEVVLPNGTRQPVLQLEG